jgi:hypothetical protein
MFFPQLTELNRESLKRSTMQALFIRLPGVLGSRILDWQREIGIDREIFSW